MNVVVGEVERQALCTPGELDHTGQDSSLRVKLLSVLGNYARLVDEITV